MSFKSGIEKIIEIYKRSHLSISKFSSLIQKDRRTVTSWVDGLTDVEPSDEVKKEFVIYLGIQIIFGKMVVLMMSF